MEDLVCDLRQMTGMDHVGITAHKAAEEILRLDGGLKDILRISQSGDAATAIREMRKVAFKALYP